MYRMNYYTPTKYNTNFEQSLTELILFAKRNDSNALEIILSKMEPLIKKYSKKLYFMEFDDAFQELNLSLVESIPKIPDLRCNNIYLKYLQKFVINKYNYLSLVY